MKLDKDYQLAPDRSYPWFATWRDARPPKSKIILSLSRFPYAGGSADIAAVPVVNTLTDVGANGVIYPLQPLAVENVLAELAAIGAEAAQVHDWPDSMAGRIARGYWDETIQTGIETQKSLDEIGDASGKFLFKFAAIFAISLGLFWGLRSWR